MADDTKNPKTPSPNKVMELPKIVRVTAITLLAYGVAMFSLGVYLPFGAIKGAGEAVIIALPIGILIGLVIILISFGLFKGGYAMLHGEAYGTGVGIAATGWGFFPGAFFIYAYNIGYKMEYGREELRMRLFAMFIFLLLNVIFLYGLSKADKILNGIRNNKKPVTPNNNIETVDNQRIQQYPKKEFLSGFLPLMFFSFFVVLEAVMDRGSDMSGFFATYLTFFFPAIVAPIWIVYSIFFLSKKHPIRAKGAMISLVVSFLIMILVFIYTIGS